MCKVSPKTVQALEAPTNQEIQVSTQNSVHNIKQEHANKNLLKQISLSGDAPISVTL